MSVLTDLIYGGSNAVAGLTEGAVNDAIAKYGADKEIAFPDTAYFFPTIYAATGVKVKTLGDLTACMELYNRGYMYDTALSYYIAPTEEDVEAYFTEHESDYAEAGITRSSGKLVDIRHILLIPQVPEDGTGTVTVAPDGTVTCSEELWDACLASAQTLVEDYEKALAADSRRGDNRSTNDAIFADLANKNSADAGSALDGGLYQKLHKG